MFYGKRTAGLAILSLPAAANAGETDMAAGVTVQDAYVQTGTQNTPASSSGETDSHADEQDHQSSVLDRIVYFDEMGETDQHAGVGVENEHVQTGTLVVAAIWSGETDSYAIDLAVSSPTQARIVYVDGMGETDRHAGIGVENEFVQTGTLVVATDSSGETDSYGIEIKIAAPVQEFFVYADGMGETDQFANVNGGNDFTSGIRLTRADIANAEVSVGGGNEERIVSVLAGETDQSAGIVMVEASISSGEVYVLLRRPDAEPNVT